MFGRRLEGEMEIKTRPWIPVLIGVVLLLGVVDQAWCQPQCAPGVIYRCGQAAAVDKSCSCGEVATRTCLQVGCDCEQKACGKAERVCDVGMAQKGSSCGPRKHLAGGEPRRLALPCQPFKPIKAAEASKSGPVCGSAKASACLPDCRYDTIFGTETIFGECPLRKPAACPSKCGAGSRPKPLASALSHLDQSLNKIFACHEPCGKCAGKGSDGCGDCGVKSQAKAKAKCECDMCDAPILEGQPYEPRRQENPFRDDAVDSNPNSPALLPPAPLPPAASAANRIRPHAPTVKPGIAFVRPASNGPAPAPRQVNAQPVDQRTPSCRPSPCPPDSMRRPSALFSSFGRPG